MHWALYRLVLREHAQEVLQYEAACCSLFWVVIAVSAVGDAVLVWAVGMPTSGKQFWWRGLCGHVWKAKVSARAKPKVSPCPYCAGRRKPERPVDLG